MRGGLFSARPVVTVGGRDRTKLGAGVAKQVAVVSSVLAGAGATAVPVHGALCFIDGDWGFRRRPFAIDRVLVTWSKALRDRLSEDGELEPGQRSELLEALARALPPAS